MSRIYVEARRVVAYTGEGTAHTDLLFDWLNGLDEADLDVPSMWQLSGAPGELAANLDKYWKIARSRYSALLRESKTSNLHLTEAQLGKLVREYHV